MERFITDEEYFKAQIRMEEIISLNAVTNDTDINDPLLIELDQVSDIVQAYEEEHYPIGLPTLKEVIELRMYEMKLKQKDLAKLLGTPAARISEYLSGKREITLNIAKALHKNLKIDSDIILQ